MNSKTRAYSIENEISKIFKNYQLQNFEPFPESNEYMAARFSLNGKKIIFRNAKITPKKKGQFVAIWKRTLDGETAPYNTSDDFDFMMIYTQSETQKGLFIFDRTVLIDKKVISKREQLGKRGMRVYPIWETAIAQQAIKTQKWQSEHFTIFDAKLDGNFFSQNRK